MSKFPMIVLRFAALLSLAVPIGAFGASGEFNFVTGEVTLVKANGQRTTPARGTPIDPGDVITTGANGMVQIVMVDNARLSLRPGTTFAIERYAEKPDSAEGAVVSLLRGTLRAFTGLVSVASRDKFVMKTRVATVGIRGSGNILYACEGKDCDPGLAGQGRGDEPITVNYTIEGSHAVTNTPPDAVAGLPPQQGGAQTLITGPGQTVLVLGTQAPRYIPTPAFIANAAITMAGVSRRAEGTPAATGPAREFAPSDIVAVIPAIQPAATPVLGNNGLGFVTPTNDLFNTFVDPIQLRDIVVTVGAPFASQAVPSDINLANGEFRGFAAYPGTLSDVDVSISGGTALDAHTVSLGNGEVITLGRWENASLGFFGAGSSAPIPGSVHWIMAPSGYPPYLSDVLTGVASYTLAAATSPTNQANTVGSLGSASLNVNFTNRTMSVLLTVSLPPAGSNAGGQWQLSATDVPLALNGFFASTDDHLTITNGSGQSSRNNSQLTGSVEGSLVGRSLNGAVLGYGISDQTSTNPSNWNNVTGVAAFTGPSQNGAAPYREGRVSDAAGQLTEFIRTYSTTDRPDEVVVDAQNRVTSFTAPFEGLGSHATYSIGSAQVVESGFDPETGLVWGRWSGGTAQVSGNGSSQSLALGSSSLHYIFAGTQNAPVSLPLTGTAVYDVIGSTTPTDSAGHVGRLNTATLDVNFSSRRLDASVNIGINGQTWNGSASNVPIYRDQYFSAYAGTTAGIPNPAPLVISCNPACGQNATGSFDGFFTGRTGQAAGLMYNLGGNQGAVAFHRHGG
ncbi:MAG: FecR domain-containing protein [Bacillota bacterium]